MTEDDRALVERLRSLAEEWFEMCDDIHEPLGEAANCIEALIAEKEAARIEERAEIVAWLRDRIGLEDCYSELKGDWLSNRIEEGEYLK